MSRLLQQLIGVALATLMLLVVGERDARATVTGAVTGIAKFWNMNGNYCPSGADCTGARYPQTDFNKKLPISNALVDVYDLNWHLLGEGASDDNGVYVVPYKADTKPDKVYVKVFAWQKESRFFFRDVNGRDYGGYTVVTMDASTNNGNAGTRYWGTSDAPDPYFNAYWAAELQWRRVMNYVGRLQTQFFLIEVRGFANDQPDFLQTCKTSCTRGDLRRVQLDTNASLRPQARIMHELGHAAEYVTKPWRLMNDGTYDGSGPLDWDYNSREYGHMAFQEAIATHYGSIAFWYDNAASPTTCLSNTKCYDSSGSPLALANLEASSYPHTDDNCDAAHEEGRWPLSLMRYLWDVYDSHNDADGDSYSAAATDFWRHLSNTYYYPDGIGTYQIDEPWAPGDFGGYYVPGPPAELDGRGARSWQHNYLSVHDTELLRIDNCSPN